MLSCLNQLDIVLLDVSFSNADNEQTILKEKKCFAAGPMMSATQQDVTIPHAFAVGYSPMESVD